MLAEGTGFEFHVDAFLSVERASDDEVQRVLDAAHARCPVSKLIGGAATVAVHTAGRGQRSADWCRVGLFGDCGSTSGCRVVDIRRCA